MHLRNVLIAGAIATGSVAGFAQVTGSGSPNSVPKFTGSSTPSSTIGTSAISEVNGNVGIGTANPGHILTIHKDNDWVQLDKSSTDTYLGITNSVAGVSKWFTGLREVGNSGNATNRYSFYNFTTSSEPMVIQETGNVGIGTTSPSAQLEVAAGGLGTTIGDVKNLFALTSTNGNMSYLRFFEIRNQSGSDWFSATTRIQQVTDVTKQGYIDFNPLNGAYGIAFGNSAGSGEYMRIANGGNVGIGTTSPAAKLDVNGSMKISGSGASMTYPDGTVQSTAWNGTTCGGDYAESIDVTGDRKSYEPGDVLVVDPKVPGKFLKSSEPYATTVMGIYSTQPGLTGRRVGAPKTGEEVPMAMLGIVPTKVSTENGAIKPGDLLVTSSTPGYAMKATDRSRMVGALIGKALDYLDSGTGVIEVGIALQ